MGLDYSYTFGVPSSGSVLTQQLDDPAGLTDIASYVISGPSLFPATTLFPSTTLFPNG